MLRIQIEPGQAYIAPTKNLIHDGAALTDTADLILTVRGWFAPAHS